MCEGYSYCESPEKIKEFLRRKYIVIAYNEIQFDQNGYFEKSKIPMSRLAYIPINTQMKQINSFKITQTQIDLQDY